MNSDSQVEGAIRKSDAENLPGIEPVIASEATIPAEAIIGAGFCEAGRWGGAEAILLVEDEAFVCKVTAEVLESVGYSLVIAGSGAEALEAPSKCAKPFDLLLADMVMPGMSGPELAAEFRSLYPHTRVLLMSGYAEQLGWCGLSPYGKTYLAKPFSMLALLRRVREVLDTNRWGRGEPA